MVDRGSGAIVNLASIAGKRGDPTLAHYSASKFAVVGFTQALAQELAEAGVTVNAVCPGTVPTPMTTELAGHWGESVEAMAKRFQATPRPQEPRDIADAVVFLASMPSITGQALNVDGGAVFS
jgi:meso-butanediol dehydrogenase/(S,S)-butanediol dehydrogenase/diacetyl reductase